MRNNSSYSQFVRHDLALFTTFRRKYFLQVLQHNDDEILHALLIVLYVYRIDLRTSRNVFFTALHKKLVVSSSIVADTSADRLRPTKTVIIRCDVDSKEAVAEFASLKEGARADYRPGETK